MQQVTAPQIAVLVREATAAQLQCCNVLQNYSAVSFQDLRSEAELL
jgi:hypothetical protein